MGLEFVEALRCIADVFKSGGSWKLHRQQSRHRYLRTLWTPLETDVRTISSQRTNEIFNVSVIPTKTILHTIFYSLDLGLVASHTTVANRLQLNEARQDVARFWHGIFKMEREVFKQANNEYTRWMQTDGVSLCVLRNKNRMKTEAHGFP